MQVFEKALGMTSKELIKAMERGELVASEVLPKVAKQFRISANNGGALNKMLMSSRVAQNRFVTGLQEMKNVLFTSGFDKAVAGLLTSLSQIVELSKPFVMVFGAALSGAVNMLLFPTRLLTSIILDLADAFDFKLSSGVSEAILKFTGLSAGFIVLLWQLKKLVQMFVLLRTVAIGAALATAAVWIAANPILAGGLALGGVATAAAYTQFGQGDGKVVNNPQMTEKDNLRRSLASQQASQRAITINNHLNIDGEPIRAISLDAINTHLNMSASTVPE